MNRDASVQPGPAVTVTSELEDHPIAHAFDGSAATRWVAAEDGPQTITVAFDAPRDVERVVLEIEERAETRTQQVTLALSRGGERFDELLRQEFVFSPAGATVEREAWTVNARDVTHVRVTILPDKGGRHGRATVTTLAVE